ncbi:hypothetical protein Ga0123461_1282 [Mariprofundus aestuarium]|uniref:SpoIIAA-like n=1 Tax=Mariprofundus aestuarium TaxID=1921086 RepID=A0A2K8KXK8_MARES|nr:hypothetical protein [Mariprofundus aestuarium]ATX79700.1 hypothetical protein Ga0123461_1282 [Mariprofundus aestuarium]
MDFTATLDEENKRIVVKSKCILDLQVINSIRTEIVSHLEGREGWDVLVDHSESTLGDLRYPEMSNVAQETISKFVPLGVRRFALVVNVDDYGMGRMWELLTADKSSISTHAFKTVGQAIQYLDESE